MTKASDAHERALELARYAYKDQPDLLAKHLISRGWILISLGHQELNLLHTAEAEALLQEALEISEQPEQQYGALIHLALNKMFRHEFAEMERMSRRALELEEISPGLGRAGWLCLGAAIWKQDAGREKEALAAFDTGIPRMYELLAKSEKSDVGRIHALRRSLGDTLACKGYVLFELGDVVEAERCFQKCLNSMGSGKPVRNQTFRRPGMRPCLVETQAWKATRSEGDTREVGCRMPKGGEGHARGGSIALPGENGAFGRIAGRSGGFLATSGGRL